MSITDDIRKGDLVKASSVRYPDEAVYGRVQFVDANLVSTATRSITRSRHLFEVLDRPLPPISEELLFGGVDAYRKGAGYQDCGPTLPDHVGDYGRKVSAVINFVREYDRNHTKENA